MNHSKIKWNHNVFSNSTFVEMKCNGKLIYGFSCGGYEGGVSFAMNKVGYLKTVLLEHPYNFLNPEEEKGRKIFWKGLPATIEPKSHCTWEIGIIPDYTCGLNKEQWWEELKKRESVYRNNAFEKQYPEDDDDFEENDDYINWGDALSDQYIGWFR